MRFVLVHGAFRGGWYWEPLQSALQAMGHDVICPDLPGMGYPAPPQVPDLTLTDWTQCVGDCVSESVARTVLVGHSMGGVVVQGIESDTAILLDAPVLSEGMRGVDIGGAPEQLPPRSFWIEPTPLDPATSGLTPDQAEWCNTRLCATPLGPQLDPIELKAVEPEIVFYNRTPPGYPSAVSRKQCDEAGTNYRLVDAPHDQPIIDPTATATLLIELGTRAS